MDNLTKELRSRITEMQEKEYGDFSAKIINNIDRERIIGVRAPLLKKLATEYRKTDVSSFLSALPHFYYEENYLHGQFINNIKDFDECLRETDKFLPFIDNWSVCDTLAPKALGKNKPALLKKVDEWHASERTYTIRFGTGVLMRYFLDDDFDISYAKKAASVRSEEYYVNMMTAWYFATALAKHYDEVLSFIENKKLDKWTHNKAIQKSIESFRITDEHKEYLRSLKIK